jgi:hypothetical protein
MMLGRLKWRTPWSDMTANSTLVTHGMWAIWSDVP